MIANRRFCVNSPRLPPKANSAPCLLARRGITSLSAASGDREPAVLQEGLQGRDVDHVEVEDRGREEDVRTGRSGLSEMLHRARTAGGDDVDLLARDLPDLLDERQVVARADTIRGLRGREDAADAVPVHFLRPLDRILPGRRITAVDVDLVARRHVRVLKDVDRDRHGLRTELLHHLGDHLRLAEDGGRGGELVGPRLQHLRGALDGRDAAAHRERDGHDVRDLPRHLDERLAAFDRRGDVEHRQLVRTRGAVRLAALDRIAGILDVDEFHALDDTPRNHIHAGHDD